MHLNYPIQLLKVTSIGLLLMTAVIAQYPVSQPSPHIDIPLAQQTCSQLHDTYISAFSGAGIMGETAYGVRALAVLKGCPWAL